MILTYLPFFFSGMTGLLLVKLIFPQKNNICFLLQLTLGCGLGLALSGTIAFTSFIVFNQYQPLYLLITQLIILLSTFLTNLYLLKKDRFVILLKPTSFLKESFLLFVLILFSSPLWIQSHFYAYGGWDAWATWNLKAKMLFLGGTEWTNIFSPVLWRASPHYPLLLPLINVWGWAFQKLPIYQVPVFTSFLFTLLTISLLFFGLRYITRSSYALLPALTLLTLPFFNKLSLSQYSDNVLGFYLLASLFCLLCSKKENSPPFSLLGGIFCGLSSFTKSEGCVAAVIIMAISFPYLLLNKKVSKKTIFYLGLGLLIGFFPAAIYYTFYAPSNITFINGLTSSTDPSNILRIKNIFAFYSLEVGVPIWNMITYLFPKDNPVYLDLKWNGLWLLSLIAILSSYKNCVNRYMWILPGFLFIYTGMITVYYYTNTYFEIRWWLQVTLHRILFTLMPVLLLWVFSSLWQDDSVKKEA